MNILLVIESLAFGGAEQVVIHLANELVRQQHKVYLIDILPHMRNHQIQGKLDTRVLLQNAQKSWVERFLVRIANSFLYRSGLHKNFKREFYEKRQIRALRKLHDKKKVDIINSHLWWADQTIYKTFGKPEVKWTITKHGSYRYFLTNNNIYPDFRESANVVLSRLDGCIIISDQNRNTLKQFPAYESLKIKKIYNGIPEPPTVTKTREELGIPTDSFMVFCASRALLEKGWEELAEAALSIKNFKLHAVFAGDGPDLEYFQSKFSSHKSITFLGFTDKIFDYIANADLCALPSRYTGEELPTFVIESFFLHKAVLATNIGEVQKMMEHQGSYAGTILPLAGKDEIVKGLKAALLNYLNNPELLKTHEAIAGKCADKFRVERMAREYVDFYRELQCEI